jgi:hypothetical protein
MVVPQITVDYLMKFEDASSLRSIFTILAQKLSSGGTLQILTDLETNSTSFKDLRSMILYSEFLIIPSNDKKVYFPKDWKDPDFIQGRTIQTLLFKLKGV